MLILLLAASVVAASAPLYVHSTSLEAVSPVIHYSPRPVWVDALRIAYTQGANSSENDRANPPIISPGVRIPLPPLRDEALQPYRQAGWMGVDRYRDGWRGLLYWHGFATEAKGDRFTLHLPAGTYRMEVSGETEGAQVDVDYDGIQLSSRDFDLTPTVTGRWLTVRSPLNGSGVQKLSVTLREGRMNVTSVELEGTRFGYPDGSYWKTGVWTNSTRYQFESHLNRETSEEGATMSLTLHPNSSWVNLSGYSNGTYTVRCDPPPPYDLGTTYTGYHGRAEGTLYHGPLDPAQQYTLHVTNWDGTLGLIPFYTFQYGYRPQGTSHLRLALGLGLGLGLPLLIAVALKKRRGQRAEKARMEKAAVEFAIRQPEVKDNDDVNDAQPSPDCVVCLSEPPEYAAVECGHFCMCAGMSVPVRRADQAHPLAANAHLLSIVGIGHQRERHSRPFLRARQ
ncbi:unnamed protein product [Cutaneotrichosporon oleaginosum]